jgi:hypothetical protein
MEQDHCYVVINGMVKYLTNDREKLNEIEKRLPKYFKAIMDNIEMADKACVEHDFDKTKEYATNAMRHYKNAMVILRQQGKKEVIQDGIWD